MKNFLIMDLTVGGVNWSYKNAGVVNNDMNMNNYFLWSYSTDLEYSKANGEVGDILRRPAINGHSEHVAIIVGKAKDAFIVAEAWGTGAGVIINRYPYNKADDIEHITDDYTIMKGELLFEKYNVVPDSEYPSGF